MRTRVPLSIAAPAAVASLAYLNGRTQFTHDWALLSALINSGVTTALRIRRDRLNLFYKFEEIALSKRGSHPCLIYEGQSWTFREAYDNALKYAAWLKDKFQVAPREVVALDFMNCPKFCFLIIALWSLGATPAFVNYNLSGESLLHGIRAATARVVLADGEIADRFTPDVRQALSSSDFRDGGASEVFVLDAAAESQVLSSYKPHREPDTSRSGAQLPEIGILIFTSGTTGLPKPAVVSWRKLHYSASVLRNWLPLQKNDIFYTCMPLYHSTATLFGYQLCLSTGTTFSLGHKFSHSTFWRDVRNSKATIIQYVGETLRYLLAAPPQIDPVTGEDLDRKHCVKRAFGNGLRPDIWETFKNRFGIETICEFYGATEGVSAMFNNSSNDFSVGAVGRFGALGRAIANRQSAIVKVDIETEEPHRDPKNNNFCARVEEGQPGELLQALDAADTNATFQGYFGNGKATNKKIMRDVFEKGDAWFRTGDMIRRDPEGRSYFVDRIGDTFRWRSENVSTNEVGEVVGRYPAIVDANVYGVELPHHEGRAGCAAIVLEDEDVSPAMLRDLAEFVSKRLPKYAVPLFLRVAKNVEATGNNKRQKHVLRSQGVDLSKVNDRLFWLQDGQYKEFRPENWESVKAGKVRL